MSEWSPESEGKDEGRDEAGDEVARVVTAHPVRLRLVPRSDDRAPEGSIVFRTLGVLGGMSIPNGVPDDAPVLAQGSLPVAVFEAVEALQLFANPVPLMLSVQPDGAGLSGVLYALIPQRTVERLDRTGRAAEEPWLASVADSEIGAEEESSLAPFALGAIVRFEEDRRFPDSLADEAVDLLASLLVGRAMDADQKRIERFLKSL